MPSNLFTDQTPESSNMTGSPNASVLVRDATSDDIVQIQKIYAHHVLNGLGSFEQVPPDITEMTRRYQTIRDSNLPFLVAESEDRIMGYAYAGPYRPRPAYRFSLENSVYVTPEAVGRGVGSALMNTLIQRCTALGYRQLVAVIGDSGNQSSIRLHEKHGFRHAGQLKSVGFKFGRWIDSVIMQRGIGEGDGTNPDQAETPPGD
jgi:phosphinothricin acetyltransferase